MKSNGSLSISTAAQLGCQPIGISGLQCSCSLSAARSAEISGWNFSHWHKITFAVCFQVELPGKAGRPADLGIQPRPGLFHTILPPPPPFKRWELNKGFSPQQPAIFFLLLSQFLQAGRNSTGEALPIDVPAPWGEATPVEFLPVVQLRKAQEPSQKKKLAALFPPTPTKPCFPTRYPQKRT